MEDNIKESINIEKDINRCKELIKSEHSNWLGISNQLAIENILNELERLQKENEELISDNLEYQRIQDIFDKRTYRKKYLEERRKEQPNLLYPDADEIYKRYYELKRENEELEDRLKKLCIEKNTLKELLGEEK